MDFFLLLELIITLGLERQFSICFIQIKKTEEKEHMEDCNQNNDHLEK